MLIFKNTYDDPENGQTKQFEVPRTDPNAPEEFYFVHIEVKNMKKTTWSKKKTHNQESRDQRETIHFL